MDNASLLLTLGAGCAVAPSLLRRQVVRVRRLPGKAEKAGRRGDFRGKSYYFCADECKEKFDKNPERYGKQ